MLALAGVRANEQAVAARFVRGLDYQPIDVFQHVLALLRIPTHVRRHVGNDDVLAQVVADDLRHVGVDHLVVGHARAGRIHQRNSTLAVRIHDSGNAEQGVGAKHLWVKEVIVYAAIDDVDTLQAGGGPHVDRVVFDDQVPPLHQLDAHLLGKERVFEIGRVEWARRHDRHLQPLGVRWCHVLEHGEQPTGVVGNQAHPQPAEDLRKRLL